VARRRVSLFLWTFALSTVFMQREAQAYLDPATGSLILQAIVGGLAALAFGVKTYWREIKARFAGRSVEPKPNAPSPTLPRESKRGDD
jgi:multisubunit Na+/H+ antiporter MnhC subunit